MLLFFAFVSFKDKKLIFVTNNATKSRRVYQDKFKLLGIEAHVVRGLHSHSAQSSSVNGN